MYLRWGMKKSNFRTWTNQPIYWTFQQSTHFPALISLYKTYYKYGDTPHKLLNSGF